MSEENTSTIKNPLIWEPIQKGKGKPSFWFKEALEGVHHPDPVLASLVEESLAALNNGTSLREVSEFIEAKSGIRISHTGVRKMWEKLGRTRPLGEPRPKVVHKSWAEVRETNRKKKLANERRRLTHLKKRISKYSDEITEIQEEVKSAGPLRGVVVQDPVQIEYLPEEENKPQVIFMPNKGPQTEFLQATEQEVLYGGAAGGGKSYAMLADPLRYFSNPNFRGLLLRRTNDELKELKWKARALYDNSVIKGTWREKDSLWRFPSGAEMWLTYLERDEDVQRYQGQSFTWIGVDELTQYATPFAWDFLRSRLRSTDPEITLSMRATSNPGGPGHSWVKKMFVDPAPVNTEFPATDIDSTEALVHPDFYKAPHPLAGQPHPKAGQPLFYRRFIPASLYDNPYLIMDDKYEASLMSLPEMQRRQLLEGDWSIVQGAAFSEFRTPIHVIKPFPIPQSWRRFRSCDFGYSTYSAVHWYAIDPDDTLYVYREMYVSKCTGRELAQRVLEAERDEKITYGILDSSVWAMRGQSGPSIAEEMIHAGCRWRPSDRSQGSRVAGKNRLHELLKVRPGIETPGIQFFDTCRQIISDLPMIPVDPKGSDDIDDRYASDHAYDSIRYGIMSRPRAASLFDTISTGKTSYIPSDSLFGY